MKRTLAVTLALVMLAGCTVDNQPGNRNGDTVSPVTVRTDHEPLTSRFPKLGSFVEAHWAGWLLSNPEVPGPDTAEIQAIVRLQPADAQAAKAGYQWEPAAAGFDAKLKEELRPYLPAGADWQHSAAYASEVRTSRYLGEVYVDFTTGTVYLDVINT